MKHKHTQFFKTINKLGIECTNIGDENELDISKLLLEYDTVLPKHILLKDNEKISQHGKELIRKKTNNDIDYYFELLRIYYVNYIKAQEQFDINNKTIKKKIV